MKKLIINLAPTGIVPTKELTEYVPISAAEIIDDVTRCVECGVSMVHLHVRDEEGAPSYKAEYYEQIIPALRKLHPDLVIVATTSGRNISEFEKRSEVLELTGESKPDMGSLTLGSMNFANSESVNSPDMVTRLAEKMLQNGIKPELEVFDLGMVNFSHYLIKKGYIKPPYYFNILLGNIASAQAKLSHLALKISELPENSFWSITGLGENQLSMNALGVVTADGIRIGLEDNIWYDEDKTVLATNEMLVQRMVKVANAIDRPIATPAEVRSMLELNC